MNNFAVFILTHGRPDRVITLTKLREQNYSGRIVLVLDDQDKSIDKYQKNYSDCEFYIFSKEEAIDLTDSADNTRNPKAVVYARNMCHKIAKELNLEYFLVLDDDYTRFDYRSDDQHNYVGSHKINNLDIIFKIFVKFLENTPTKSIAFSQGGDFIGGYDNNTFGNKVTLHRKCMNSFFCKTDRPFQFYGLINEDVNCYVLDGSRGDLFFTSSQISLEQTQTQKNDGGLTTIYLELGTYVKSFYSVMYHPSSVTIEEMRSSNRRLHHRVDKNLTYPKILRENYRKN